MKVRMGLTIEAGELSDFNDERRHHVIQDFGKDLDEVDYTNAYEDPIGTWEIRWRSLSYILCSV